MRTKSNVTGISSTHFYVYENNPGIGITKFFNVGSLVEAQLLAGKLNCAWGVSDVRMTIDLVSGRLEMLPIEGSVITTPGVREGIVAAPLPTANRRGRKPGRKLGKRAMSVAPTV